MRKNFWSFLVVLLATLFVGATAVQAADISFGGDTIVRAQYVDTDEDANASDWEVAQRVRFNTTVKGSGVTAFTQFDAVQAWASDVGPGLDTHGDNGSNAVGVHQANLTIPTFFGSDWTAKLGRQEIVFDGHRIFGHTGWNLNAVTHDAAVFINPGMDLTYALSWMIESNQGNVGEDRLAHVVRKGANLMGGKTALYWVTIDDSSVSDATIWHTAGLRQTGKAAGYDYRVEGYFQFGEVAPPIAVGTLALEQGADIDEAYMIGARIGKKVGDTKVTLWYDYTSGTDDAQANANEWGTFNQLYDTGHKFYGLIDKVAPGGNTDHLGLQDLAIKFVKPLAPGWTLKADIHQFWTAVDPGDNRTAWANNLNEAATDDSDLGHELDLTLKNKYNANTAVQFGYSYFNGTTTWQHMDSDTDSENSHWAYAQVKFAY